MSPDIIEPQRPPTAADAVSARGMELSQRELQVLLQSTLDSCALIQNAASLQFFRFDKATRERTARQIMDRLGIETRER